MDHEDEKKVHESPVEAPADVSPVPSQNNDTGIASGVDDNSSLRRKSKEKEAGYSKAQEAGVLDTEVPGYDPERTDDGGLGPLETAEDIVTHVIHVDDDQDMNPWTFRMFFLGEQSLQHNR